MRIGYRRVSTLDQNMDRQTLSVDKLFEDRCSGKNTDRNGLNELLSFVRNGDEVIVHSIDRLARDLRDLQTIVKELICKGVTIKFENERLIFDPAEGDLFSQLQLNLMGAFAEFERKIILKRQAEGIARAKEKGIYLKRKRKPKLKAIRVKNLKIQGFTNTEIASLLGVSRMTVYRKLKH